MLVTQKGEKVNLCYFDVVLQIDVVYINCPISIYSGASSQ